MSLFQVNHWPSDPAVANVLCSLLNEIELTVYASPPTTSPFESFSSLRWHLKQKSSLCAAVGFEKFTVTIPQRPSILPTAKPYPDPKQQILLVECLKGLSSTWIGSNYLLEIFLKSQICIHFSLCAVTNKGNYPFIYWIGFATQDSPIWFNWFPLISQNLTTQSHPPDTKISLP